LSYHDYLTGLYNRRFYAEELKRLDTPRNLPLTLAVGDINGLKLVNDSFGHVAGDRLLKTVSEIFKEECRPDDITARIGGDEFVIILPKTDMNKAGEIISRIQKRVQNTNIESVILSISFGCATKNAKNIKIEDVFNDSENKMYRDKLYESNSVKSKMIEVSMQTLYKKTIRKPFTQNM
jgi:diguanylate cyclase (GGDEF)-like protein